MNMEIVFPGGKKVDALYKDFRIETDQSKRNGGDASRPAPFDLFLASLGTCAGAYVLWFCEERKLSANKIKLILSTSKNLATGRLSKVKIAIKLPDDFPEKYKKAIVRAAETCAVTKHLQHPPVVEVYAENGKNQSVPYDV